MRKIFVSPPALMLTIIFKSWQRPGAASNLLLSQYKSGVNVDNTYIWYGSPATEQIGAGVESADIDSAVSVSETTSTLSEHDHGADEESAVEESRESAAVPDTPPNHPAQEAAGGLGLTSTTGGRCLMTG